jgi:zinc transport system permease protein
MISSAALAFGYLMLNLFGDESASVSADACATLFGSGILGIGIDDVILCSVIAVLVLIIFVLFYNKIFAVTFDEDFATATGIRSGIYNTAIAVITAVTVVAAMNLLGALLASALVIFPALCAMRLFKTFKGVTLCAVAVSLISATAGTLLSLIFATATGPTVVVVELIIFIASVIIGTIINKRI